MTSILLISPPSEIRADYPRMALAYLSANLKKAGIEHDILELALYKDWKTKLGPYLQKYSLIGISATTGEMRTVEVLVDFIKELNPGCTVLLGGIHATLYPKETLTEYKKIDYCLRGEGEETLIDFLTKDRVGVKGLCCRDGNSMHIGEVQLLPDLNDRPFPSYDKFELDKYYDSSSFSRTVHVLTSRGCPYACTYCSKGLGNRFRPRTPEDVVAEMEYLKATYNVRKIRVADDNFSFDLGRAKKICNLMIERKLNVTWINAGGLRVDKVDDELLHLMKISGCIGVGLGIESVSDRILKEYKKGTNIDKVTSAINMVKKYGMEVGGFFLIGAPGDTREEIYKQLDYAKKMKLDNAYWSNLIPFPGTEIWDWISRNNYWVNADPFGEIQAATTKKSLLYSTPFLGAEEKNELIAAIETDWSNWKASRSLLNRFKHTVMKNPWLFYYATKMKAVYDAMNATLKLR